MANDVQVSAEDVLNLMRVRGDFAAVKQEVLIRKASAEAARLKGITISDEEMQSAADAFRLVNGLHSAKNTMEWLESAGLGLEAFEEYLETNLLIRKFKESLHEESSAGKFLESEQVKTVVRDLAYAEWLKTAVSR